MESNENLNDENKAEETQAAAQEAEVTDIKKDEVDYKDKYFRLAAEMDNYRKRVERDREDLLKFGNTKVLGDLIDVIDTFERTISMCSMDQDPKMKNVVFGLDMVKKQFIDTLGKHGLTPVEALGKEFDPNFHEAVAQEYEEGKKPNEVIKEFQKGYILNGRLIRAAKVVVANDKQ